VEEVSSSVEGGWLASWWQGLARHRGCLVGTLCEEGWEESKWGEGRGWKSAWDCKAEGRKQPGGLGRA